VYPIHFDDDRSARELSIEASCAAGWGTGVKQCAMTEVKILCILLCRPSRTTCILLCGWLGHSWSHCAMTEMKILCLAVEWRPNVPHAN
jgi:hypothetical protein